MIDTSPTGLRNRAAQLRRRGDERHLTYGERVAALNEADRLEVLAERLENAAPESMPRVQISTPLPPVRERALPKASPAKSFRVNPARIEKYKAHATHARNEADRVTNDQSLRLRAEARKREASRLRAEATNWDLLASGLMPPGWTPDGPVGRKWREPVATPSGKPTQSSLMERLLSSLGGLELEVVCHCERRRRFRSSELAARMPSNARVSDAIKLMRCEACGERGRLTPAFPRG